MAAAQRLEAGKGEVQCLKELQAACKGLAIGKYCGMSTPTIERVLLAPTGSVKSPTMAIPLLQQRGAPRVLWHWRLLALALALLLAPALGQMHRVLHGDGHGDGHGPGVHSAGTPVASFSWAALFSGHHASDCQLLDSLSLADAPPSTALAWAHPLPFAQPLISTPAPLGVRRAAPFQARAPPGWNA